MPDFTPQALAAFGLLVVTNLLVLFGLDIGASREAALEVVVNSAAIIGFLVHDAVVRHGRAKIAAAAVQTVHPEQALESLKAGEAKP